MSEFSYAVSIIVLSGGMRACLTTRLRIKIATTTRTPISSGTCSRRSIGRCDSNQDGVNGPLREMVNRIGAQAAIVRRSIDRLWEDQSIESCDDWVIPYIADLLATKLVSSYDPLGQRVDVSKTIYYRQRKGTVAILEEIGHDITQWDVKIVEFFRRLSRTRHNFDPPIGLPTETDNSTVTSGPVNICGSPSISPPAETNGPTGTVLQSAEGLVGTWTHTAIGGTADLRNVYGSSRAQTAFDEFFHTADFRSGQDKTGWQNIPHLGVFLWQLYSYPVPKTTPVPFTGSCGRFTVDPTGREIPLFATSASRPMGLSGCRQRSGSCRRPSIRRYWRPT